MTETTCPACGDPIQAIERVDEVTYELSPCGHAVDELTRADLTTVDDAGDDSTP